MTREEYIKNNSIIQKALLSCTQQDLKFITYIGNGGKLDTNDLRLKQLIFHMCSNLNLRELSLLKKSFNILMKL